MTSALNRLTGTRYSLEKIREIAQNIEAQIIRVPTGVQDYYPAMYGGVNAIELGPAGVRRVPVRVDLDDFNQRIVLAYTGEPRNSGINNWEVTKAHIDGDRRVRRNFDQITAIARAMRAARRESRLEGSGPPAARRMVASAEKFSGHLDAGASITWSASRAAPEPQEPRYAERAAAVASSSWWNAAHSSGWRARLKRPELKCCR